MDLNKKNVRTLLGIITFAILLFVGLWHLGVVMETLGILFSMISFFIIGLCIAFIFNVPLRWMETKLFKPLDKRFGKRWQAARRPLSVFLTILLMLVIVLTAVFMVIPEIARTVVMIGNEMPGFIKRAEEWFHTLPFDTTNLTGILEWESIDWNTLANSALDLLQNGAGQVLAGTFSAATSIVSSVVSFVVGIILAIYVLMGKERLSGQFRRLLYAYLPETGADWILETGASANRIFSSFIGGQFLESVILGTLCFLGMTIFRFPFAPMVSVLVGVTAVIPIFGAFIGCFVGVFMILVHQGFMSAVWFIVFFVVLQQIEGNIIYPHVVGKSVMLPGIWVLVAVTVGGNIAGILGMLISVPLAALCYTLLRQAVAKRNEKRGIRREKLYPKA